MILSVNRHSLKVNFEIMRDEIEQRNEIMAERLSNFIVLSF